MCRIRHLKRNFPKITAKSREGHKMCFTHVKQITDFKNIFSSKCYKHEYLNTSFGIFIFSLPRESQDANFHDEIFMRLFLF